MLKSKINPDLSGKLTKLIFTFLFFIFLSTNLFAQVTQEWVSRYDGQGIWGDVASSLAVDSSGNVYVTGQSCQNYTTIKYNSNGDSLWVQRFMGHSKAYSLAIDNFGNVYVTGWIGPYYGTIKYNSNGDSLWVRIYRPLAPASVLNDALSIAVDNSGNVYVTGRFDIFYGTSYYFDYGTLKYNTNGILQWVQRYTGPGNGNNIAYSIVVDGSGNAYVTGNSQGDYATIKYNTSGGQQWVSRYNGLANGGDGASSLAIDNSSNVYVTGFSMGNGTGYDYATVKYNTSGVQQWVQRYNGPGNGSDVASSLAVDNLGNVYVTGSSEGIGTGSDYTTIKYNSYGDSLWVKRYNGTGNSGDGASSIAVDDFRNVYVTGYSNGSGTGKDIVTIKYNTNGFQQWIQRYNGPGNGVDSASSIAVDDSGNVYVTGISLGIGTKNDYVTIKYSQPPPPPLCTFNLQSPLAGDTITSVINSTIPVSFSWDTSATGVSYKWLFGTSLPTRLITRHVYTNSLTMTLGELDDILAGLGVTPGNQLSGAWDVWAFRPNPPQNDSLKAANGPRAVTLKRGIPTLIVFNLLSPPNGTQINTFPYNDTLIHMKWTRSGDLTTYKWKFGSPTIANLVFTFEANNSGYDSVFSIRNSSLDSVLASHGLQTGDSIAGEWAVWAYNGFDSLKSTQIWSMILKRISSSVRFYDPFTYGTGNWTITNNGGTCVWQIFSTPYPSEYVLPSTSVSPVLSADGLYCGPGTSTRTTATVVNNINCVGYENILLEFDNDWANAYPYGLDSALVEVSYNGGTTWVPIISWGPYDVRNTHEIKSLSGAANVPNLKVRFRTAQHYSNYLRCWWVIDNVAIKGDLVTGITKSESQIPTDYALSQNYPNPFNPSTKIKFDIPKSSYVKLIVYDVLGREISTLVNEKLNAGRYEVNWPAPTGDGSVYPSGVYFYKLIADEYVSVKKMLMIK